MYTKPKKSITISQWSGGLNVASEVNQIADNETPNTLNCIATKNGVLTQRPGTVKEGDTMSGAYGVGGLFSFERFGESPVLLSAHNDKLYKLSGTSWASIKSGFTPGLRTSFLAYDGYAGSGIVSGTATGSTSGVTILDATKGWNPDQWKGYIVHLLPVKQVSTYTVSTNPSDGETIVVGEKVYTYKASGAVGDQINIGATANDTASGTRVRITNDAIYTYCTASGSTNQIICTATVAGVGFATLGDGAKITVSTSVNNYFGESRNIISNTNNEITVDAWNTVPVSGTTQYEIKETNMVVYVGNGSDTVCKYDGTNIVDTPNVPVGHIMALMDSRLYVVPENQPNLLYYSAYGEAENFHTINTVGTGMGIIKIPTPDKILGISVKGSIMVIQKERSVWQHSWSTDSNGNLMPVFSLLQGEYGAYNNSMIEVGNDIWSLTKNGVQSLGAQSGYISNGFNINVRQGDVSNKIINLINVVSETNKRLNEMFYFDNKVFLSLDTDNVGYNNHTFVYDMIYGGWWKWDIGARCFTRHDGKMYYGSSSTGNVYYFDGGAYSDDNNLFDVYHFTKVLDLGFFNVYKSVTEENIEFENVNGNVTIENQMELGDGVTKSSSSFIINPLNTGANFGSILYGVFKYGLGNEENPETITTFKRIKKILNMKGQNIQIKIGKYSNSTFVLSKLNIVFRPYGSGHYPSADKY